MSSKRSIIFQTLMKLREKINLLKIYFECKKFMARDLLILYLIHMSCLKNMGTFTTILFQTNKNLLTKTFGFRNHLRVDKGRAYL